MSSGMEVERRVAQQCSSKTPILRYIPSMGSKAKIGRVDERRNSDGRKALVASSEGVAVKTAKPVAATPDLDDFVKDLLVTDKIILDHLLLRHR